MKTPLFCSVLPLLIAPVVAAAAPKLAIEDAAKIAQMQLKERGLAGSVFVTSLTLEKQDLRGSTYQWAVRWSEAIPLDGEKKELGLQIGMDGKLVRVVRGAANRNAVTGVFDPNGPRGLQNHRTRADRPSILSLKH